MRYIGSKLRLTPFIRSAIERVAPESSVFCDLFAGTGAVGNEFKKTHRVIANDILYFSYVLNAANLQLFRIPEFVKFRSAYGTDPISYLNQIRPDPSKAESHDFVAQMYSPIGGDQRRYFSPENAIRIDRIRQIIEASLRDSLLNQLEYFYLLAALLREVPSVSSTTGTYGAFLKSWDKRALKEITLRHLEISPGCNTNEVFNGDANEIIAKISGDVLYLDTPYNARQYSSNYHVLESIARYDSPQVIGVTGLRADRAGESGYCRRNQVYSLYKDLLEKADFKVVVISYNSEGILSEDQLVNLVSGFAGRPPIAFEKIPYRRYKRTSGDAKSVEEFLVVGRK
jgi:adenine-specific DNA-methyltransferase